MQFSITSLALSLLPLALAQYDSSPTNDKSSSSVSSAAPSSSAISSTIHKITVGQGGSLLFNPNTVTAAVGDFIEWHFFPPTHSVVQASFSAPCAPNAAGAFSSGGFVTASGENANVFRVMVNSTDPLWFYCGFPGHCQGGMVGVVNPPADKTVQQFASAAATAPFVAGVATVKGGVVGAAATQSTPASSATPSSSATTTPAPKSAGVEAAGGIRWMLLGLTGLVAVGFGGWIV